MIDPLIRERQFSGVRPPIQAGFELCDERGQVALKFLAHELNFDLRGGLFFRSVGEQDVVQDIRDVEQPQVVGRPQQVRGEGLWIGADAGPRDDSERSDGKRMTSW